jgi:aspartate/methionine/tyrosine aminotransferase
MEFSKAAQQLSAQGADVIQLNIGEPDFTAAPAVVSAMQVAVGNAQTQYTPALGLPALREAIAQHYQEVYGVTVAPSRIVVTAGASAALLLACAALVEPGDEVLMADPCYPCNRHFVGSYGGTTQLIPTDASTRFQLTQALLDQHWSPRTQGVMLATPANPTGTSIPFEQLAAICASAKARGAYRIVDEIYVGLTYDGVRRSVLECDPDAVVVQSFSKYFNMTGWRLGWIVAPEALVPVLERLAQNLFICASSPAQRAALACFESASLALYETRRAAFKARRDYLVPALQNLGFTVPVVPDGAFYVYADVSRFSDDSAQFARDVLHNAHVALTPGLDFGQQSPKQYVRFSYAADLSRLQLAVARLGSYLNAPYEPFCTRSCLSIDCTRMGSAPFGRRTATAQQIGAYLHG